MTADNYAELVKALRRRPVLRSTPGRMDLDDAVIADAIEALVKERDQLRAELARVREVLGIAKKALDGLKIISMQFREPYSLACVDEALAALAGKGEGER